VLPLGQLRAQLGVVHRIRRSHALFVDESPVSGGQLAQRLVRGPGTGGVFDTGSKRAVSRLAGRKRK